MIRRQGRRVRLATLIKGLGITETVLLDTLLLQADTQTVDIDTLLKAVETQTVELDTLLKGEGRATIALDVILGAAYDDTLDMQLKQNHCSMQLRSSGMVSKSSQYRMERK
jgi:hypothetical protein